MAKGLARIDGIDNFAADQAGGRDEAGGREKQASRR